MGRGSKDMPKPHRTVFISNQFWPVRNFALEMRSDSFFSVSGFCLFVVWEIDGSQEGSE